MHLLPIFDILGLPFGTDDLDRIMHNEHLLPRLRVRCARLLVKFISGTQFLRFHSQDDVVISSWSIQCICTGSSLRTDSICIVGG